MHALRTNRVDRILRLFLLSVVALGMATGAIAQPPLWNTRRLAQPPAATFGERNGLVQELYYEGEPYQGKPTRVFAYYARPEGTGPFPGMVLVHGGGGKAFSEWAKHWAERGYAAIAMDLSGNGPSGRLPDGGPDQGDGTKFRPFEESEAREMWTYHAVAAAMRAHSLLASRPEVDKKRIGLTGISWGGYLTCIIAGVDHRFKVAVPVYGCGFLHEDSVWKEGVLDKMPETQRERWVRLYDPSRYLPGVRCPILFLNGTNDFAYPMDSYKKCYSLVKAPRTLSVQIRLPHGHIWTYGVVDAFVDSVLKGGRPLPKLGPMRVREGVAEASVRSSTPLAGAELYYTEDGGNWQDRKWLSTPARLDGGRVTAQVPSGRPVTFHLAVKDADGNIVTTQHEELLPPAHGPNPKAVPDDLKQKVDRLVEPIIKAGWMKGVAIGLIDGDKTYAYGYGRVSDKSDARPDSHTLYEIGSITKAFTGILLAEAIERKEVKLEDPISSLLPGTVTVPTFEGMPVTLLDLTTHYSGLPRMPDNFAPKDPANPFADYDEKRLYAFLSAHKLRRKPGQSMEYSNVGAGLLGFGLARRAGTTYETLVKQRVLDPLGMRETFITLDSAAKSRLAQGHNQDGKAVKNWDLDALQGAGALRSNVHDMLLFLKANINPEQTSITAALKEAQLKRRDAPGLGGIGFGWHIHPDGKARWHNGGTAGYRTLAVFNPETKQGVVVLSNSAADEVDPLGFGLLRLLTGHDPGPIQMPATITLPSKTLDAYIGTYSFAPGATFSVTQEKDGLYVQLTGQDKARLYASSEKEFFIRVAPARFTFERKGTGKAEALVLHQEGHEVRAKRVP